MSVLTRRRVVVVGGLLLVTLLVAVTIMSVTSRFGAAGPASSGGITTAGVTIYPLASRPDTPNVEGATVTGQRLNLASRRGHVLVINVWGSWCAPCRAEAPDLVRAAREASSKGVRFVGIDTRDTLPAAQAFTRRYGITYPSLFDPTGVVLLRFSEVMPISAIPSTLVVDREGRVAARAVGKVDYTTLKGLIDDALAAPTAQSAAADLARP